MLKLNQQSADSYILGFSAFTNTNKISAATACISRKLPPVSQTFSGAHNQGLARRVPANMGSGNISITNVVAV